MYSFHKETKSPYEAAFMSLFCYRQNNHKLRGENCDFETR